MHEDDPWLHPRWIRHGQILHDSFERWLGRPLLKRSGDAVEDSRSLYEAPFVLVSHDAGPDPLLTYGNRLALDLWETTLEQFLGRPSRETAEAMERDERARMLERTSKQGYIDDYTGIRITARGNRFRIHAAIIWNLVDESGEPWGQAATFRDWTWLGEAPAS